jgi:hypothetical protein
LFWDDSGIRATDPEHMGMLTFPREPGPITAVFIEAIFESDVTGNERVKGHRSPIGPKVAGVG